MWKPSKSDYEKVKKLLKVHTLLPEEEEQLHEIQYAYENPVEIDWVHRATLMALEEKYKAQ
ncbi:hypothetical protein [Avibacterium paragallinarum]|uniref:Uncharacterized protein n=1 Tax=Avibacterium paragallinarum TaxID=728 RepID=A0A380X774_AVIPA|nr:hypothetical protein [Avibacterium paragallinarum]KAA6207940.1 hypothetical protein F1968_12055 [Avibacterium paragallinarum]RZN55576.1 hypothetical protein EIG78_10505 [Avibacterium paragallinarum]RZN68080.1 hypothetical protein EIG77_11540 [Avibacterium paragallinarum]SUU97735.1 Uncharacterised protein [Avibacterium paragallinarum]SUU98654.1 Uncharacterised protein [Avibacterium paragallinarum]